MNLAGTCPACKHDVCICQDGVPFTLDMPIQAISRIQAEVECRKAGMDMNKLFWLRWMAEFRSPIIPQMERF